MTHVFAEVGHTHAAVDQRLSVVSSAFTNTDVIQTPEDSDVEKLFKKHVLIC